MRGVKQEKYFVDTNSGITVQKCYRYILCIKDYNVVTCNTLFFTNKITIQLKPHTISKIQYGIRAN